MHNQFYEFSIYLQDYVVVEGAVVDLAVVDGAEVEEEEVGALVGAPSEVAGVAMEVALGVARKYQSSQHNYRAQL